MIMMIIIIFYDCAIIGEFGIVYKGHILKDPGPIVTDIVAMKTLKGMCLLYFACLGLV